MAAKKKAKSEAKKDPEGFVLGYELRWMQEVGEAHPDYHKVIEEAKKRKLIK